jgi:hypothetical protein
MLGLKPWPEEHVSKFKLIARIIVTRNFYRFKEMKFNANMRKRK